MKNQEPSYLKRRRMRRIVGVVAVLWTIVILALFMLPEHYLPQSNIEGMDDIFHFGSLLVFSFLYMHAYYKGRKRTYLYILLFAIVFGVAVEFLQVLFTASRAFQLSDIKADILGAATGIALFWGYRMWKHTDGQQKNIADG
ncbi:MAG: hypothetical protein EOP56_11615 [Sphingobacteriales bacterium]|nr:MAG: hypothetical protein EOP56_11615 [Sphingobacteriales bacterium]